MIVPTVPGVTVIVVVFVCVGFATDVPVIVTVPTPDGVNTPPEVIVPPGPDDHVTGWPLVSIQFDVPVMVIVEGEQLIAMPPLVTLILIGMTLPKLCTVVYLVDAALSICQFSIYVPGVAGAVNDPNVNFATDPGDTLVAVLVTPSVGPHVPPQIGLVQDPPS